MIEVKLTMSQLATLIRELRPEEVRAFSEANPAKAQPNAWRAAKPADNLDAWMAGAASIADANAAVESSEPWFSKEKAYKDALRNLAPHSTYHNSLDVAFAERDEARRDTESRYQQLTLCRNERERAKRQVGELLGKLQQCNREYKECRQLIDSLNQQVADLTLERDCARGAHSVVVEQDRNNMQLLEAAEKLRRADSETIIGLRRDVARLLERAEDKDNTIRNGANQSTALDSALIECRKKCDDCADSLGSKALENTALRAIIQHVANLSKNEAFVISYIEFVNAIKKALQLPA